MPSLDRPSPEELVDDVRLRLAEMADPTRAPAMRAYMKSALPYRGVSMPQCRKLWRVAFRVSLSPQEWWRAVRLLWDDAEFREDRYAAIGLIRHPRFADYLVSDRFDDVCALICEAAWWDLVDELATHVIRDLYAADRGELGPRLLALADAPDMWLRRTSIIAQMGLRETADRALLAATIEANLDGSRGRGAAVSAYGKEFFIRKAIGWALRDYAYYDPAWVAEYVETHRSQLSGLSIREATKHLNAAPAPGRLPRH